MQRDPVRHHVPIANIHSLREPAKNKNFNVLNLRQLNDCKSSARAEKFAGKFAIPALSRCAMALRLHGKSLTEVAGGYWMNEQTKRVLKIAGIAVGGFILRSVVRGIRAYELHGKVVAITGGSRGLGRTHGRAPRAKASRQ
jgi:hypothetical protein